MTTKNSSQPDNDPEGGCPAVPPPKPALLSRLRVFQQALQTKRWQNAFCLVSYVGLAMLLFHRAWRAPNNLNIGTGGDPMLGMWALRWIPYALSHSQGPFLTNHLNYPFGVNLMWNSPLFLHGLILWPVSASLGPVVAYNAMVTVNVTLSAWCGFLLCRMFVTQTLPSFCGGLLYGFSPYMMAQARDHSTLIAAFVPPLMVMVLYEILVLQRRPPRQMGIALGLLVTCQLLIAEELLASEALLATLAILVTLASHPRSVRGRAWHALKAVGVASVLISVLCVYPLVIQFLGPHRLHGAVQPPNVFVSDLANLLVPTRVQQLAPHWALVDSSGWTGNLSEYNAYLGLPLLLLMAAVAIRRWHLASIRVASIVAVLVGILSLGPSLHVNGHDTHISLPWRLLDSVPLINNILPARLMLYVDLVAALFVAVAVGRVLSSRRWLERLMGAGILCAVAATLMPILPYPANPVVVPRFFTDGSAVRSIPRNTVVLIAPFQQLYPAEPMLWQAETYMRFRMPQGYFIGPGHNGSPVYGAAYSRLSMSMLEIQNGQDLAMTPDLRSQVLQDLAVRQVNTVVVGPMLYQAAMLHFFGFLFGKSPLAVSDVYVWYQVRALIHEGAS